MMKTTLTYTVATIEAICNPVGVDCSMVHVHYTHGCGHELPWLDCSPITFVLDKYKDSILECSIIDNPDIEDYPDEPLACMVTVSKGDLCPSCTRKMQRVYCDEGKRPVGFDDIPLYHGIHAYCVDSMKPNIEELMSRVDGIILHQEWQICCSTKHLGPIGVEIKGEVLCASNADLFTEVGDNGRRYYNAHRYRASHVIYDAKDLDPTVWSHDEIVTHKNTIVSVWVKKGSSDDIRSYGQVIADILGVKYIEVEAAQ